MRRVKPLIQATDEELIEGSYMWHAAMPGYGASREERERWRLGYHRWCADRGTDPLHVIRLRRAAKMQNWT
jgi:hypothetical protein